MAKAKARAERTEAGAKAGNILPSGQLYRIRFDMEAIRDNQERRRSALGAPRRLRPVVIVVDESDTAHYARSIRTLGAVTFAEVDTHSLEGGIHALRGAAWLATTRDAVELIND